MSAFMSKCKQRMRSRNLAYKTEKSYSHWIKRFILFHNKQHPEQMGAAEVVEFINWLAASRQCSPATQNQALCALVFLYKHVVMRELGQIGEIQFAKKRISMPVVLSKAEVFKILSELPQKPQLIVSLLYGSGLRVSEALALRIQDVDFETQCLYIRFGKGRKDRVVTLSSTLINALKHQISAALTIHKQDLSAGYGYAPVPNALRRKFGNAIKRPGWQYVFPSSTRCCIPDTGDIVRFHQHPDTIRKAISAASQRACISKRVTCHTFRHSFATHLLQSGADIRTVQDQLGHADVKTTEVYTHIIKRSGGAVISPLDSLNSVNL